MVEQEPVDDVRSNAAADRVGALEHERVRARRGERPCACEAGRARADDDHVVARRSRVRAYRERVRLTVGERAREAGVDVGLPEGEPGLDELRGRNALPSEEHLLAHLAERGPDRECRQRKDVGRWSARPSALVNSRFVVRARCGDVDGPLERMLEGEQVGGDRVVERDPAPPLPAAADPAARAELEGEEQALQRAALPGEDDPLPQVDGAEAGCACGLGRGLPLLDDVREEPFAPGELSSTSSSPRLP